MKSLLINDLIEDFRSILNKIPFVKSRQWVQRVEPPYWWTEMKHQEIQLMLYGNNLSCAEFSIEEPGVSIDQTVHTENKNCVFLYLNIDEKAKSGKFNIKIRKEKAGKKEKYFEYELKKRKEDSASRNSFSEADAIYLIMPDRFVNGNPKNDSANGFIQGVNRKDPRARHGGDIKGIISKIDYLSDLGITALWTTPLFENNDTQYSYHHYACSDYYKIDPRFGKNEDYLRLSNACHSKGLKLIIDVVPNHCGSSHWWMKDLPDKNWINTWSTYTSTNYKPSVWTDPHASSADLNRLAYGWFAPNMPDLNLQNTIVFDYLRQVYVFWIESADIAGMRVDVTPIMILKPLPGFFSPLGMSIRI